MNRILLSGCNGKMGLQITKCIDGNHQCEIVGGIDLNLDMNSHFPVFTSISDFTGEADVIIDFSSPKCLDSILSYALRTKTPVVFATTGYNEIQIEKIILASNKIPIFRTANFSIGINLITKLAKLAASALCDDYDIEIIEAHHNQKLDAPSGTALMLADEISKSLKEPVRYEYDRHSKLKKRDKDEIGIHAIRGGTIVGEHEIIFAGRDEIVKISHAAYSKDVFAVGAINAAMYLTNQKPGIYDMKSLINDTVI